MVAIAQGIDSTSGVIQVRMLVLVLVFFRASCNMRTDIEA